MRGRFAGFLILAGGILIGAGVYPTWVTAGGHTYNGFSTAGTNLDAVVSLVIAGVLVLLAFSLAIWVGLLNRLLVALATLAALLWAGVLALVLGPWANLALNSLAPNVTRTTTTATDVTFGLGFYLIAGGAVVALLGCLVALVARRRVVVTRAPMTGAPVAPASAARTAQPLAPAPASGGVPRPSAVATAGPPATTTSSAGRGAPAQPR